MVTVSNITNNKLNIPVNSSSLPAPSTEKSYVNQNFHAGDNSHNVVDNRKYKKDTILPNTFMNRMRINISKTLDIPLVHFPRGLAGAPDYTFYEFLQTAKFPYYLGGPILAALFYAGVKKDNFKSARAAQGVAKHMALGVGLYYLGAALAKSLINHTVKFTKGIDLRHPYAKAISTSTSHTGDFKKDVEYHTLYESSEFTRTDLMYEHDVKKSQIDTDKIARKYGVKGDVNDADQTVKPLIKKTIIMARAWQYALTAFFVTLGIGMANQKAWDKMSSEGFKKTISKGIFGRNVSLKNRLHNAKLVVNDYMLKPFGQSFKQFWHGHSKASSIVGKSVILSSAAAALLAMSLIATKTSARDHKIESSGANRQNEVNK